MVPTRWSHSPHGKGFSDSCSTNVSATRSLAFRRCPLAPRSPDLSACDFFLWGYLKSKVYVRKPRTVDDLKVSIREEIATVPQEMLVNVMQYFEERLRTYVRQEGCHLSDIIFRNWVINVSNQNCIYYSLFWCWHNFFVLKINKVTIIWKTCVLFEPHCICCNLPIKYIVLRLDKLCFLNTTTHLCWSKVWFRRLSAWDANCNGA